MDMEVKVDHECDTKAAAVDVKESGRAPTNTIHATTATATEASPNITPGN